MKQYEAVIQAMRKTGGYATLAQLYRRTLEVPDCKWGTKTPFASIRRIVQTYPQFFRIKPGLWGLTEWRQDILKVLSIEPTASPEQINDFDHAYYQGLAVEIGNLQEYQTFIPGQDKNKKFLSRSLGKVASLEKLYSFTYDRLVKRASTIDVVWFNERNMPRAFFEIEHTTDFRRALLNFLEFQYFRTKFHIVADPARQNEFGDVMGYSAFKPLRGFVQFVDYVSLSKYHSKVSETVLLGKSLKLRDVR